MEVIEHYNDLEELPENTNLDFRLAGSMHDLDFSQAEKEALEAFLLTLTGEDVYTNEKWSDPFDESGDITIIPVNPNGLEDLRGTIDVEIYPNPTLDRIVIELSEGTYQLMIFDDNGSKVSSSLIGGTHSEEMSHLTQGVYFFHLRDLKTNRIATKRIVKL
jgi:cytochrome c peroxidase